jgi:AmiR/NasT family two-component response regulator
VSAAGDPVARRALIDEARGLVASQFECTPAEALALMEKRAVATLQTIDEVARAVLDQRVRYGRLARSG